MARALLGENSLAEVLTSDNLLNSWEVLALFFMVTSEDVLKVLWFSDSTQILRILTITFVY